MLAQYMSAGKRQERASCLTPLVCECVGKAGGRPRGVTVNQWPQGQAASAGSERALLAVRGAA